MPNIVERTLAAGAVPPLDYLGAGATSVVFCDARGHGFKTARRADSTMLVDEAEWLAAAAKVPGVREHVARFHAYHPGQAVIERECVASDHDNDPAWRWRRGHDLFNLHQHIGKLMEKHAGWSAPEYKGDSYIVTENRGPVLVDAGFVYRLGRRLLHYVADVLEGRRPWRKHESPDDLAFYLRREVQEGALTNDEVAPVMARLRAAGASGW
jgi:hypothetical protein